MAPSNGHRINTPAFARSTVIASHPPPEFSARRCLKRRYVHDSRHETARVSAPCLTTSNGTGPIDGYRPIIASYHETAASRNDVLKCVAAVGTEFENAAIKAEVGIDVGRFQIEVVPE